MECVVQCVVRFVVLVLIVRRAGSTGLGEEVMVTGFTGWLGETKIVTLEILESLEVEESP